MTTATHDDPAAPAPVVESENADERELIRYLSDRDVFCPLCGYNLRRLTRPRCPECGRELRLSVGLTEPYLRAWVVLAAAACGAGGTGLFFCMMVVRAGWPRVFASPIRLFVMNASFLYFMAMVPVAVVVLLMRRRFIRLATGAQWAIAWTCAATSVLAMVLFIATVN